MASNHDRTCGSAATHSTAKPAAVLSLPVLSAKPPPIRRSRNAWKRAAVLGVVQALIILHVVHWLVAGRTVAPIEPSEAMETLKHGVVNAGFIFFALALASTAILGRWVCGWACHVILLQDLCAWIMKKAGIRPKAFRSRLLVYLPLGLALYMFAWPVVYRLAVAPFVQPDLVWPGWTMELTTTEFWRTFPGLFVAVPFLFVCGFACVYFLGSKGYCTYGCPYGGFFAPLDELATGRIRVTDDCEHCGHCTAVCTSNVRVHEEVRDFGMVVDPGCMKCMDCVSVCPNDALYFGFGKPAKGAAPRALGPISIEPPPRPTRAYDLSWPEEIVLSVQAVATFLAVRGAYDAVPLLFASGIAGCVVFLSWKAWRCLRDPNVRFHRWQLRLHGRLRPAGAAWLGGAALSLLLVAHTGVVNAAVAIAGWHDDRAALPPAVVFSENPIAPDPAIAHHAREGRRWYRFASFAGDGGIGLLWGWQPRLDLRMAWLAAVSGDLEGAESILRTTIERRGPNEAAVGGIARIMRARLRGEEALAWYREWAPKRPAWGSMRDEGIVWLDSEGLFPQAIELARLGVESAPDDLRSMRRLSLLLIERGDETQVREGIRLVQRTLEIAPGNAFAYRAMALGHGRLGELEEALPLMRRAVEIEPSDWRLRQGLAELLQGIGLDAEASEQSAIAEMERRRAGGR
jgi:polyferredoxin/tetratricopeptide (TPR) repeat protein